MKENIQKKKNVINSLFFLFLFFSLNLFCQEEFKGKYFKKEKLHSFYSSYTFLNDNVFRYESGGDLGADFFGKGHYNIVNDSLVFNYDLTRLNDKSYHKSKEYYNNNDSVNVKINLLDFKLKPVLANIQAWSYPLYQSTESGNNGEILFRFKKGKQKIEVYLVGENIEQYIVNLNTDRNYEVNVYLKKVNLFQNAKLIKDQITKIKISDFKSNYYKK